jgi:hypothetical protein
MRSTRAAAGIRRNQPASTSEDILGAAGALIKLLEMREIKPYLCAHPDEDR